MSPSNVPEKYLSMTVKDLLLHEEKIVRLMIEYTIQEVIKSEATKEEKK